MESSIGALTLGGTQMTHTLFVTITSYFVLILSLGCTTGTGGKPESDWEVLDNAKPISCKTWPIKDGFIRIDDMHGAGWNNPGVIVSGPRRNGSPALYFHPMATGLGASVDKEPVFALDSHSILAKGTLAGEGIYAGTIATNQESGKSKFVVQSLPQGKILLSTDLDVSTPQSAELIPAAPNPGWVVIRSNGIDEIRRIIAPPGKDTWQLSSVVFKSQQLIAVGQNTSDQPWVLHLKRGEGEAKPTILLTSLGTEKGQETKVIEFAGPIEAVAAHFEKNALFLGAITGDTVVGDAKLVLLTGIIENRTFSMKASATIPLENAHISQPYWIKTRNQPRLIMPMWLDGESTLGSIGIEAGNQPKFQYSGIFPEGLAVIDQLPNNPDQPRVIVRSRIDNRWRFSVCRVDEP